MPHTTIVLIFLSPHVQAIYLYVFAKIQNLLYSPVIHETYTQATYSVAYTAAACCLQDNNR